MIITAEHYSNVKVFLDALKSRSITGKCGEGVETENDPDFTEYNYKESLKLVYSGIDTIVLEMKEAVKGGDFIPVTPRPRKCRDYSGFSPNVPAAIAGEPKSMYRMARLPQKVKTINLIYNVSVRGSVHKNKINKSGKTFFNLAYNLEKQGFRVKITLVLVTARSLLTDEQAVLTVALKDYKDSFDIQKLSFPLCSVAMYRVLGFSWREKAPLKTNWGYGKGSSLMDKEKEKALLKESGFNLNDAVYMNINDIETSGFNVDNLVKNVLKEREGK